MYPSYTLGLLFCGSLVQSLWKWWNQKHYLSTRKKPWHILQFMSLVPGMMLLGVTLCLSLRAFFACLSWFYPLIASRWFDFCTLIFGACLGPVMKSESNRRGEAFIHMCLLRLPEAELNSEYQVVGTWKEYILKLDNLRDRKVKFCKIMWCRM